MADLNRVTLIGNIGRDPETRTMDSGDEMARFSMATSRSWKKDGEWVTDTAWHNVVVFNKFAAAKCRDDIQKGDKVYVEGELKTRSYEKDGVTKYVTEIIVPNFTGKILHLGRPEHSGGRTSTNTETTSTPATSDSGYGKSDYDDDIPF